MGKIFLIQGFLCIPAVFSTTNKAFNVRGKTGKFGGINHVSLLAKYKGGKSHQVHLFPVDLTLDGLS